MSQQDSNFWTKARRARDKLVAQFLDHPDVALIDIGLSEEDDQIGEEVVLRIHVRPSWFETDPETRITFPEQMSGISIRVIPGEYRFEE